MNSPIDIDEYGVPLDSFGGATPEFFDILGRIVAVNGKIEYLRDRLNHLPDEETRDVVKVAQFLKRCETGRLERNAVVHSNWVFGAHKRDPSVIVGVRYKQRRQASGYVAAVSIRDVVGDRRSQDVVEYTPAQLRDQLRHDLATLQIGEIAYAEIMLTWVSQSKEMRGFNPLGTNRH